MTNLVEPNVAEATTIADENIVVRFTTRAKVDELRAELDEKIVQFNDLPADTTIFEREKAAAEINQLLKVYNTQIELCDYEDLLEEEVPIRSALDKAVHDQWRLKVDKEDGSYSLKLNTERPMQINFVKFNKFALMRNQRLLDAKLRSYADQMAYAVTLLKASSLFSVQEITNAARADGRMLQKELTKKPSNKEMKRTLQKLMDAIYFEDNGNGENCFMVTNDVVDWFVDATQIATYVLKLDSATRKSTCELIRNVDDYKQIVSTCAAVFKTYFQNVEKKCGSIEVFVGKTRVVKETSEAESEQK